MKMDESPCQTPLQKAIPLFDATGHVRQNSRLFCADCLFPRSIGPVLLALIVSSRSFVACALNRSPRGLTQMECALALQLHHAEMSRHPCLENRVDRKANGMTSSRDEQNLRSSMD